jgi:FdhD protein
MINSNRSAELPMKTYRPKMSQASNLFTFSVDVTNASGRRIPVEIPGEFPLTIRLDGHEIATLMTIGTHPEALVLGYLRNQGIIRAIEEIASVKVDWEEETAQVVTLHGNSRTDSATSTTYRMVTSGCGQSMMFDCLLQHLYARKLPDRQLRQSAIYSILRKISDLNTVYRTAGSVHACALCSDSDVLFFVEDVGRHNAVDVISGRMWLEGISGEGKILYTTGRLTSEMILKAAWMGIAVLISKSGTTRMGLELAKELGLTMVGRMKKSRFLVYCGLKNLIFDALPEGTEER